jgi:FHS family L-fucose permease-like MFS transporter
MQRVSRLFRGESGESHAVTFALVSVLFLLWGFCNGMLDTLDKHFQNTFHITKGTSALVPCATYFGYAVMAIPAGFLSRRFGYKFGILTGLALVAVGAFWFIPATHIGTFSAFLLGLFIIGNGLTFLETAANPYTTVLGPPQSSAVRINLAQSGNAVGATLGPAVAGFFILSSTAQVNRSNGALYLPYLGVGIAVTVLFVIFWFARIPDLRAEEEDVSSQKSHRAVKPLWKRGHFVLAVVAQFLYVAAQTGIFNFFINYVTSNDTPPVSASWASMFPSWMTASAPDGYHFTDNGASKLLSYGGMMLFFIGRFAGTQVLRFFSAHGVLAVFAAINTLLMVLICLPLGWISFFSLFLSFFFISIMFPTIFALGIRGLGEQTKFASSFLVMAIVGGAVMPLVMGSLADHFSMRIGFLMPLGCFIAIVAYALAWPALERRDAGHEVTD